MSKHNFRNAEEREKESYCTYLVESCGYSREKAEHTSSQAHIGMLENYQGNTPSYRGDVMIVFHQNLPLYEAFVYRDKGDLEPIAQDPAIRDTNCI